jgi:phosphatidylglycerol lysyltransferase
MKEFGGYCVSRNLTIAFIQSTNRCKKADPAGLLRHVLIGADAVINLKRFNSTTVHNKYFRNIVNRFEKHNFSVTTHHPPHSKALVKELCQVSDSWLKLPHRKEWSFLTGSFDIDYLQQMTLHVLRDANGKAQAFVNELPSFKIGVATIDLMRRLNNAPANCMDFLFICLMKDRLAEGYKGFSLGMSPLDGKPYIANRASKAVHRAYRISNKPIV